MVHLPRTSVRIYDLDKDDKLGPMQVLEEAMRHFYRKAKIEELLGRFCDFRIVDKAIETAARIAREIVSFRHPRISAIKLAVADPNADLLRGDMRRTRCARLSGASSWTRGCCLRQLSTRSL